jgi:hypothetical protein
MHIHFLVEESSTEIALKFIVPKIIGILPKITLVPEYQKINGSRMIAPYLNLENTRSLSFYHFINSIKKVIH